MDLLYKYCRPDCREVAYSGRVKDAFVSRGAGCLNYPSDNRLYNKPVSVFAHMHVQSHTQQCKYRKNTSAHVLGTNGVTCMHDESFLCNKTHPVGQLLVYRLCHPNALMWVTEFICTTRVLLLSIICHLMANYSPIMTLS